MSYLLICLCSALLPVMQGVTGFETLTLSVSATKSTVILGEPVRLRIEIGNRTAVDVPAHRSLSPEAGLVDVTVLDEGASQGQLVRGSEWGTEAAITPVTVLRPGQAISGELVLIANVRSREGVDERNYFVFPKPGRYRVVVRVKDISGNAAIAGSALISVESVPDAEKAIFELLDTEDGALFLDTGHTEAGDLITRLQLALSVFPTSVFAKPIAEALQKR